MMTASEFAQRNNEWSWLLVYVSVFVLIDLVHNVFDLVMDRTEPYLWKFGQAYLSFVIFLVSTIVYFVVESDRRNLAQQQQQRQTIPSSRGSTDDNDSDNDFTQRDAIDFLGIYLAIFSAIQIVRNSWTLVHTVVWLQAAGTREGSPDGSLSSTSVASTFNTDPQTSITLTTCHIFIDLFAACFGLILHKLTFL